MRTGVVKLMVGGPQEPLNRLCMVREMEGGGVEFLLDGQWAGPLRDDLAAQVRWDEEPTEVEKRNGGAK